MKKYINKIHYSQNLETKDKIFESFLTLFSKFYLIGINTRNFLYSKNILKRQKLDSYVISVGNLTTGGTGKTPITIEIAQYLAGSRNKRPAILSHGYGGGLPTKNTNIISDGKNIFYTPYLAGDEPFLMAQNTNDIAIITGKSRAESGRKALDKYNSDVLILDDGFQHIKLQRDLNILVIDCCKKFGNNKVLPAGPLREPLEQIERADKIILVNKKPFDKTTSDKCTDYSEYLKGKYNKPVYISNFKKTGIYNIVTKEPLIKDQTIKAYAFAGIAQPEFFFNELAQEGFELVKTREFTDHHLYTDEDLKNIMQEAISNGAQVIITTEKDAVKLSVLIDEINPQINIFALKLGMDLNLDKFFEDTAV